MDEKNDRFNTRLAERQRNRRRRGELMAEKLVEAGYALDLEAIRQDVGDGVWGRPHIARALVRAGHATSKDDAFDRFLGGEQPWSVPYEKWQAADVVRAVRAAGGVSSIAHAIWYRDAEDLIRALAAEGLDAIEVFHPDHGPAEEARFGAPRARRELLVPGGSDFHGTPEGRKDPGGAVGDRPRCWASCAPAPARDERRTGPRPALGSASPAGLRGRPLRSRRDGGGGRVARDGRDAGLVRWGAEGTGFGAPRRKGRAGQRRPPVRRSPRTGRVRMLACSASMVNRRIAARALRRVDDIVGWPTRSALMRSAERTFVW